MSGDHNMYADWEPRHERRYSPDGSLLQHKIQRTPDGPWEDYKEEHVTKGCKFDSGKLRWSLIPEGVMEDVIKVLEYGAQKYAPDNWKHVPDATTRYYDAAMRHIDAWWKGEHQDGETGQSHLAHAMCCLMFLQWLAKDAEEK